MEFIFAIVKALASWAQTKNAPAQNPVAQVLAQQQAADAATCQMLADLMAQEQAQQMALLQQLMGPSPFFWG
jgi:hypothetical protein